MATSSNGFLRLRSANCEKVEIYKEYKSGASFKGLAANNKKVGKGTFTWPNGDKYEGEFVNNVRAGEGNYIFTDIAELAHINPYAMATFV